MQLAYKETKPSRINLKEFRDGILLIFYSLVVAVKNCMFAEEQSDVQEFFLYLIDELSREIDSFSSLLTQSDEGEGWEEVGTKGKRLVIRESTIQRSFINELFEIQLRKNVREFDLFEGRFIRMEKRNMLSNSLTWLCHYLSVIDLFEFEFEFEFRLILWN